MRRSFARFVQLIFTYRIDVIALCFALIVSMYPRGETSEILIAGLSFSLLIAFVYIFNKTTDSKEDTINQKGSPLDQSSMLTARYMSYGSLFVGAVLLAMMPKAFELFALYAITALIGFLYSYPLHYGPHFVRLKQVLHVKTLSAAILWVLGTAVVRVVAKGSFNSYDVYLCLLVFGISVSSELIWDIRDIAGDAKNNIRTIPVRFGVTTTKILIVSILSVVLLYGTAEGISVFSKVVLLCSICIAIYAEPSKSRLFFHLISLLWLTSTILRLITSS